MYFQEKNEQIKMILMNHISRSSLADSPPFIRLDRLFRLFVTTCFMGGGAWLHAPLVFIGCELHNQIENHKYLCS